MSAQSCALIAVVRTSGKLSVGVPAESTPGYELAIVYCWIAPPEAPEPITLPTGP
jgi:hypothetical protein